MSYVKDRVLQLCGLLPNFAFVDKPTEYKRK